MPFQSKAQQRFMFATMPITARKWADETPDIKKLPQKLTNSDPEATRKQNQKQASRSRSPKRQTPAQDREKLTGILERIKSTQYFVSPPPALGSVLTTVALFGEKAARQAKSRPNLPK